MKDLSMHIMDIFQNSIRANSTLITIDILEDTINNLLRLHFTDNGDGMNSEMVKRATDPFVTTRTTRKVGLGLSLLKQNTERAGGSFQLWSEPGKGTTVTAEFVYNHLDRPSLGDVTSVVLLTSVANPDRNFIYRHTINGRTYCFSTSEVKEVLGDVPLNTPEIYGYLHEMITENMNDISAN